MTPSGFALTSAQTWMWIAIALLAAPLAVWAYRSIAPSLRPRARSVLMVLRAIALAWVAILLARPILSLAGGASGKGTVVVLTDVSRSMDLPADSVNAKGPSRLEVARAAAAKAARSFGGRATVVRKEFASGAPADSVTGAARERSAIGDALLQAVEGVEGARGVVLVSDGAQTAGRDAVSAARELGLPVATVAVGEMPARDIAIVDVLANPTARVGQDTPAEVRLRALGAPRRVKVSLLDAGTERASKEVALPGGGAEVSVRLTYKPTHPGLSVFEVSVPADPAEWSDANNRRAYAQEVLPDRQKVLVLAGSYHWDWTWTKRAIAADSAYAAEHWVFARGHWSRLSGARGVGGGSGAGDGALPASTAALRPYALAVLVGVEGAQLPAPVSEALARWIEGGGSAVVVGGAARNGVVSLSGTALGQTLGLARAPGPAAVLEAVPSLTEAGRAADLVRLEDDAAANAALWGTLPPLENVQSLAVTAADEVDVTDASGRLALLVERRAGRGKAIVMNGASSFRWGFASADVEAPRRYERLWSHFLRELSQPAQTEPLRLVAEKALVTRGEPVRLEAALQDAAFRPVDGARITAKIQGPVKREVVLEGRGEGSYGATLEGLPPGRYSASASALANGRGAGNATATFWVDAQSAEWQDVAPDAGLLAAVARAGGAASVRPGEESKLPAALLAARPRVEREKTVRLWEEPFAYALAIALLSTEWWLRRKRGLA
jgi:hypothetical protein